MTIQLVDSDTFDRLAPLETVLPHYFGSFEIVLESTEKKAVRNRKIKKEANRNRLPMQFLGIKAVLVIYSQ